VVDFLTVGFGICFVFGFGGEGAAQKTRVFAPLPRPEKFPLRHQVEHSGP